MALCSAPSLLGWGQGTDLCPCPLLCLGLSCRAGTWDWGGGLARVEDLAEHEMTDMQGLGSQERQLLNLVWVDRKDGRWQPLAQGTAQTKAWRCISAASLGSWFLECQV